MKTRLGLDIGTSSIGWWLYRLENGRPAGIIDGGVRIFSDGREPSSQYKIGKSLAVARREARAARRRRDRYLRRRTVLMQRLADAGLMPADPTQAKALEVLDPYALRAKGLDEKLPLTHFGRALFHLNQRRGFKSNRKTDGSNEDRGMISKGSARLDQAMMANHARSLGEFLHMRRQKAETPRHTPPVRTRTTLTPDSGKTEKNYDFYPDRRHLEEEFHKLWRAQARHHPALTDALRDTLFETIFYQRPLKAPKVGLCLFTNDRRLPKAHPLTQRRVIYETVNNLRVVADGRPKRPLTLEQRDKIIHALDNKKHTKNLSGMKLALKALGKLLKLREGESFSLETAARDSIACDPVRASLSHPSRFGPRWSTFSVETQWEIIQRLQEEPDPDAMETWLQEAHGLDAAHARATAKKAHLPEGYSRLGETATRNILAHLQAEVLTYNQAVEACGWKHSDDRTGEILKALPYYGKILERHVIPGSYNENDDDITRFGRITNPTVHIGLNQVRRLVNKIIDVHGKPEQIVVELARDLKQNEMQKAEIKRKIKANTAAAIERGNKLAELGVPDTGANRARYRLWEELGPAIGPRCCPYTGETISAAMIFDGSCDVDHILPYSRTLDDSFANRTLCLKEANREKRNKTPWEAWGDSDQWAKIEANLKNLPENKRWRFAPDAMQRFEGENDFTSRALNDTAYLSRIAKAYLEALYTEGGHVWVVPGRLTEMLRRHWRLNFRFGAGASMAKAKNRHDHRHHAIDAAVIAATDRGLIQKIQKLTEDHVEQNRKAFAKATPPPWGEANAFRNAVRAKLETITISHRADHGRIDPAARKQGRDTTMGKLHEATALGIIDNNTVAVRISVDKLKPAHLKIGSRSGYVRDSYLREQLAKAAGEIAGKEFTKSVVSFFRNDRRYRGTRRLRIVKSLRNDARIPVPFDQPRKAYQSGSNQCFEIWRLPDGKFVQQAITTFEVHNPQGTKRPHPAAKRLLRLYKNDMVAIERDGETVICYVQKTDPSNGAFLVPHNETNADKRSNDPADPFKWFQMSATPLMKAKLRRVYVDEIGQVRDPGPPKTL